MVGRTPLEVYRTVFPDGGDPAAYLAPIERRESFRDQLLYVRDTRGQSRWLVNQGRPVHSQEGVFTGFRGAVRDVTAQRNAEKALRASEQRLRLIADNLPALVSVIDRSLRFTFNNRTYASVLGKPLEAITGQRLQDVYDADTFAALLPHLTQALEGEQRTFEIEVGPRAYRVTYVPDRNAQGETLGIYALAHDISLAKQVERELQTLSRFDPLTALANRRHYDERLRDAFARSERSGAPMALMFLDLDHFKRINDTFGHEGGDAVLVEFARRLVASTRQTDTVARIAGDEFVIILEGLHDAAEAETVARKILAAMRPPLAFAGRSIAFSATLGVAVRRAGETDGDALLKRADDALYAAKREGRGGYAVSAP
jgi:diguanylate cyclase (GGDEF)-like protein/PAS domain S-box-containing protein